MSNAPDLHGQKATSGWIGVDLDGTLAFYDVWRGATHIGPPIPAMVQRIKKWLSQGRDVRIFTARVAGPPEEALMSRNRIMDWLENECGLPRLPVTNTKDYSMEELWDDRAVRVVFNKGISTEEAVVILTDKIRSKL